MIQVVMVIVFFGVLRTGLLAPRVLSEMVEEVGRQGIVK